MISLLYLMDSPSPLSLPSLFDFDFDIHLDFDIHIDFHFHFDIHFHIL
jgi:hypothetical protein